MSEEEKGQNTKKLGIIALATAVLSRKTALGKTAIVLLILEIPAYLVLNIVSTAPAA
jgi:hypothetical protein